MATAKKEIAVKSQLGETCRHCGKRSAGARHTVAGKAMECLHCGWRSRRLPAADGPMSGKQ